MIKFYQEHMTIKLTYFLVFIFFMAVALTSVCYAITSESPTMPLEAPVSPPSAKVVQSDPVPIPLTVEEQIRAIAEEHNFEWPDYLVRLSECEASLQVDALNIEGNYPVGSRDRGLYQINDYWHSEVSDEVAFDIRLSTEWTMWMINSGNQKQWSCDSLI